MFSDFIILKKIFRLEVSRQLHIYSYILYNYIVSHIAGNKI